MHEPDAPEVPRTWELMGSAMSNELRSRECNEIGQWAIGVLTDAFGKRWPLITSDQNARLLYETLRSAGVGIVGYAQIVELALRLRMFSAHAGIAAIRNQLRRDLTPDSWHHAGLQLEVAALAAVCGHAAQLESRLEPGKPPIDVSIITRGNGAIRIETFALFHARQTLSDMDYDDDVGRDVMMIQAHHEVSVVGDLPARLGEEETRDFLASLDLVAARVARSGTVEAFSAYGCQLRIGPGFMMDEGESLNGPVSERNPWPRFNSRFRSKAEQAVRAGAGWLRVDILDGLWQFTQFALWDLPTKAAFLRQYVHDLLTPSSLDGVVFSSGALIGVVKAEDARGTDGACALRRPVQPARTRETIIVPLTTLGQAQVAGWYQLYDRESRWLTEALKQAGLAAVPEIGEPSA